MNLVNHCAFASCQVRSCPLEQPPNQAKLVFASLQMYTHVKFDMINYNETHFPLGFQLPNLLGDLNAFMSCLVGPRDNIDPRSSILVT